MTGFRELVAIVVVACLINVGFPQQAQAMAAAERDEGIRQKVEQLGVGAEVRVKLRNQEKQVFRGTIRSIDEFTFQFQPAGAGDRRTIRYADVTLLEFTKEKYRAVGSPDPVAARRVAVELGVGRKVRLTTQDRKSLVGRIARLELEQLSLDTGDGSPIIAYSQMWELEPLNTAAKGGLGALTVLYELLSMFASSGGH